MWNVYDAYDDSVEEKSFYSIEEATDFVTDSDDPLTWRIRYSD